jgi:hypothetical protein
MPQICILDDSFLAVASVRWVVCGGEFIASGGRQTYRGVVTIFHRELATPDRQIDHKTFVFSLCVAFRVALIYGGIAALSRTLDGLLAWQKVLAMNYAEMIRDRDDSIENEIRGLVPKELSQEQRDELEKQIHKAFEQGARVWEQQLLPVIAGSPKAAAKIIEQLRKEQVLR